MVKEFKQNNYWALILGGSSGLGLATAEKLANHGMNICIVHRNSRTQLKEINTHYETIKSNGIQFLSFNIDALNANKREAMLTELKQALGEKGKIRTLVHSIAKGNLKPMLSKDSSTLNSDDFGITINAMAISLYDWTKAIFAKKLFAASARVVSFTSEGNTKAWKNYAAVSAAKASLEAISRSVALEFAPHQITANCIQAGVTDTDSLQMIPGSDAIIKHSLKRNPYKRLTLPKDIANAVYLLSKDEAGWINGTVIKVDGGEHLS